MVPAKAGKSLPIPKPREMQVEEMDALETASTGKADTCIGNQAVTSRVIKKFIRFRTSRQIRLL
jgi:hypothetical protein